MIIHVVQPQETIQSIAEIYGVSAEKLIIDNELINPEDLVPGQTIVITYPQKVYIVQDGDTLESIAVMHNISVMQLLRNNPILAGREYIYPGELLVISYGTNRSITTFLTNTIFYICSNSYRLSGRAYRLVYRCQELFRFTQHYKYL